MLETRGGYNDRNNVGFAAKIPGVGPMMGLGFPSKGGSLLQLASPRGFGGDGELHHTQ